MKLHHWICIVALLVVGCKSTTVQTQTVEHTATPEQIARFFLFDGELLQEYEDLLVAESDTGPRIRFPRYRSCTRGDMPRM